MQAYEKIVHQTNRNPVALSYDALWTSVGGYYEATRVSARLTANFNGEQVALTFGTGPDHSVFDVYIDGSLWQGYDGYAPTAGERTVYIPMKAGAHKLQVRNRADRSPASTEGDVYRVRVKAVEVVTVSGEDEQTLVYNYDRIARLLQADTYAGTDLTASPIRTYAYTHDRAGNRLQESISGTGVTAKTTDYEYNAANQIAQRQVDGGAWTPFVYDPNGNLTSDGSRTQTWDRANRMIQQVKGGTTYSYAYDGNGDRYQQTADATVTQFLNDTQPGLTQVIAQTASGQTERFLHGPVGIHAQQNDAGNWSYMQTDALGSVRSVIGLDVTVAGALDYDPFGNPIDPHGTLDTPFGYAGEYTDPTGDVFLRARNYDPTLGAFTSLDPFEGLVDEPMSLNGYSYAHNNPIMHTDPSGNFANVLLGAGAGFVVGGLLGQEYGRWTYHFAVRGECGCHARQEALNKKRDPWISEYRLKGGIMGGIIGAVLGSSPAAAAAFDHYFRIAGVAEIVSLVKQIGDDFFSNMRLDNKCLAVDLAFELFDLATEHLGSKKLPDSSPPPMRTPNRRRPRSVEGATLGQFFEDVPTARLPTIEDYEEAWKILDYWKQRAEAERWDHMRMSHEGEATETFYRTMSEEEYAKLERSGRLTRRRSNYRGFLGVTEDARYMDDLPNRPTSGDKYVVVVEFEVKAGTLAALEKLGALHVSNQIVALYPNHPIFQSGMDAVQIKSERDGVISFGLGTSDEGLNIFNNNIIKFTRRR